MAAEKWITAATTIDLPVRGKVSVADMTNFPFTRRAFLGSAAALGATAFLPSTARAAPAYRLTPAPAIVNLVGAEFPDTAVWAYGGQVPGPQLRLRQGETLRVDVTNGLDEPTTVHWHGLRLPNGMDGVPELTQAPIAPGTSFSYEFKVQDAGTFWYHPHVRTTEQLGRGLYGALIVDEANPPKVDRDVTWVIDDWRLTNEAVIAEPFDSGMDLSHGGRSGNTITVNGKLIDKVPVRAGERVRLRLINVANARVFGLRFDGENPTVIALDGHPVTPHTPDGNMIVLASGQRADVIIDFSAKPGSTTTITDAYSPRYAYEFAKFVYADGKPLRESPLDAPIALAANPVPEPDLAAAQKHEITIDGGAMGTMRNAVFKGDLLDIGELVQHGKIWSLNGVAAHSTKMAPMLSLKHGASHVIRMLNNTGWDHPMHLHGHAFRILTRNGKAVPHTPWADTVLLAPRDDVEVALVADNPGDWLYHCHILEHHAAGMAAVIRVA